VSYSVVPGFSAELVLCVAQGARSSKFERHRVEPRALSRRLSHAAARIERTTEYQQSLDRVLELGQRFQQGLDAAQKERWLALEDALFEHTSRLHRAYFQAGAEWESRKVESRKVESRKERSRQASHLRSRSHRALGRCHKAAPERATRDAETILALAELIVKLAAR